MMDKIGLIVGKGKFPVYFINEAQKNNIPIELIVISEDIDEEIKNRKDYVKFNIGNVGEIVKYLLKNNIKKVTMLGKVEKSEIFSKIKFDDYGQKILDMLPDKKDETLLFAIIAFLKLNGIKVLRQDFLMKNFIFEEKCYTLKKPSSEDKKTIKIGIEVAKKLSEVDVGQSIVCRDKSVVCLEAIEGTDETIKRAYKYSNTNNILIKMSRPQQDKRVDIPVIGFDTVKTCIENGVKGIVAESKKMIFLDKEKCIDFADKNNFFIVGKKYK